MFQKDIERDEQMDGQRGKVRLLHKLIAGRTVCQCEGDEHHISKNIVSSNGQ